ncbi:MAG: hypothetical protein HYW56_00520 [Candidatus Harrisonbacteria bacterium]|nr:hypothetical protein [Candidatus Harrisonbacteria bacterium]
MVEEKDNVSNDVKELVIARLDVLPSNRKISVGSEGEFTKTELIEHVKGGDAIGKTIIELELEFLRALKDGTLLEEALAASSK